MPRNYPLDRSKTDSGALKLRIAVQSLERSEELGGMCHIESGAIVLDTVDGLVFLFFLSECNQSLRPFRCVLPCIPEQVYENNRNQLRVPGRREPIRDLDSNFACGVSVLEVADCVMCHRRQINHLRL